MPLFKGLVSGIGFGEEGDPNRNRVAQQVIFQHSAARIRCQLFPQ